MKRANGISILARFPKFSGSIFHRRTQIDARYKCPAARAPRTSYTTVDFEVIFIFIEGDTGETLGVLSTSDKASMNCVW